MLLPLVSRHEGNISHISEVQGNNPYLVPDYMSRAGPVSRAGRFAEISACLLNATKINFAIT